MKTSLNQNRVFLDQSFADLHRGNAELQELLIKKEGLIEMDQKTIIDNNNRIQEKEQVEKKYNDLMRRIGEKENKG